MKTTLLPMVWDPGIRPDPSGLPPVIMNFITRLGGGIYAAAYALAFILLIVSIVGAIAAKTGTVSQGMQKWSIGGIVIAILGIFALAVAPDLFSFAGTAGS